MDDQTTLAQIIELANQLTVVSILLLWLRTSRKDNQMLWSIVSDLIRLRLRQVEDGDDIPREQELFPTGRPKPDG